MERTLPVEVMSFGMENIRMFLLVNSNEEHEFTEVLMIRYTLIKMVNTGLYGKSIER